jgi:hypothetical protein
MKIGRSEKIGLFCYGMSGLNINREDHKGDAEVTEKFESLFTSFRLPASIMQEQSLRVLCTFLSALCLNWPHGS